MIRDNYEHAAIVACPVDHNAGQNRRHLLFIWFQRDPF